MTEKVVHTQANSGKWLTVKDVIFHRLPEDGQKELLLRVLLSVDVPIVTVPSHVRCAIDAYGPDIAELAPYMVRLVLRQVPSCYSSLHREEKLLLLRCCLSDRQFADLCGLQLLPLSNGTFAKFGNGVSMIYIDSPKHPRELFPGIGHRLLDKHIDADILQNLEAAALQGMSCSKSICLTCESCVRFYSSLKYILDFIGLRLQVLPFSWL